MAGSMLSPVTLGVEIEWKFPIPKNMNYKSVFKAIIKEIDAKLKPELERSGQESAFNPAISHFDAFKLPRPKKHGGEPFHEIKKDGFGGQGLEDEEKGEAELDLEFFQDEWCTAEFTTRPFETDPRPGGFATLAPLMRPTNSKWRDEITKIVQAISETTTTVDGTTVHIPIRINASHATHVHVGYAPDEQGFGLRQDPLTVKKLGTLVWLAESRLEKLSHIIRQPVGTDPENSGFGWNAQHQRLNDKALLNNANSGDTKDMGPIQRHEYEKWLAPALRLIEAGSKLAQQLVVLWTEGAVSNVDAPVQPDERLQRTDLIALLLTAKDVGVIDNDDERLAINFRGLITDTYSGTPKPPTVEFRQMESNFNPGFVQSWAGVCESLLLFAQTAEPKIYLEIVGKLLRHDEADYSILDLLDDICYKEDVEYFKNNMKEMKKIREALLEFYDREKIQPKSVAKLELMNFSYIIQKGKGPLNQKFWWDMSYWY